MRDRGERERISFKGEKKKGRNPMELLFDLLSKGGRIWWPHLCLSGWGHCINMGAPGQLFELLSDAKSEGPRIAALTEITSQTKKIDE